MACIRNGVYYKRHRWGTDENGLKRCQGCEKLHASVLAAVDTNVPEVSENMDGDAGTVGSVVTEGMDVGGTRTA